MTGVERDVIPYGMVVGDRARLVGLNLRGLQRRGFSKEDIQALRSAYRMLFAPEGTLAERLEDVANHFGHIGPVDEVGRFIRADSSRAIWSAGSRRCLRPRKRCRNWASSPATGRCRSIS